jgi:hypothetical protein
MVSFHLASPKVSFFSQKAWKPVAAARQGLPKLSGPQHLIGPASTKRKDSNKGLCLDLAENLFIFLGFPYLHNKKMMT